MENYVDEFTQRGFYLEEFQKSMVVIIVVVSCISRVATWPCMEVWP